MGNDPKPVASEPSAATGPFLDKRWNAAMQARNAALTLDANDQLSAMAAAFAVFDAALAAAEQRGRDAERVKRGIYIASKVVHADRWRLLRDKIGYPIISTWIDEAGVGESNDLTDLWDRCISEASAAEVLVINCEPGEVLKGGWVELGAALASGVPVLAVGIDAFTVANHRGIRHMASMKDVMTLLKPMANGESFAAAIRKGD